jgi:hypothetical protein
MFGLKLFGAGCKSYLGPEASQQMVQLAHWIYKKHLSRPLNYVGGEEEVIGSPVRCADLYARRAGED